MKLSGGSSPTLPAIDPRGGSAWPGVPGVLPDQAAENTPHAREAPVTGGERGEPAGVAH
ncbi:hypothetical protein [Streptomyces variegatus]|uniref:hypothetical protein n=1 Tax=Streptomyces variegatus TaxID=284040 RepID=UPI003C2CDB38